MSVHQEQVQVVPVEAIEIRTAANKALSALMTLVKALFSVSGDDERTWARVERITWHPHMRHEPSRPEWYGGGFH